MIMNSILQKINTKKALTIILSDFVGLTEDDIRRVLIGERPSMEGLQRLNNVLGIVAISKKRNKPNPPCKHRKACCTHVVQLDLDGNYVATHRSVRSAAKSLNKTSHAQIFRCLNGECETMYGYKWIKLTEYEELNQLNVG